MMATIAMSTPVVQPEQLDEWNRRSCAGAVAGKRGGCKHKPKLACIRCSRAYCGYHAPEGRCRSGHGQMAPYKAPAR